MVLYLLKVSMREYLKEILTIWILGSLERGVESVADVLPITASIYRDFPILICALDSGRETPNSMDICAFEKRETESPFFFEEEKL